MSSRALKQVALDVIVRFEQRRKVTLKIGAELIGFNLFILRLDELENILEIEH
jgi:hypothetical protein